MSVSELNSQEPVIRVQASVPRKRTLPKYVTKTVLENEEYQTDQIIPNMVRALTPLTEEMRRSYMIESLMTASMGELTAQKKASINLYLQALYHKRRSSLNILKWYAKWLDQGWQTEFTEALRRKPEKTKSKKKASTKKKKTAKPADPGQSAGAIADSYADRREIVLDMVTAIGTYPKGQRADALIEALGERRVEFEEEGNTELEEKIDQKVSLHYDQIFQGLRPGFNALHLAKFYAGLFDVTWEPAWTATITKSTVQKPEPSSHATNSGGDKKSSQVSQSAFARRVWEVLAKGTQDVTRESFPPSAPTVVNVIDLAGQTWLPGIILENE